MLLGEITTKAELKRALKEEIDANVRLRAEIERLRAENDLLSQTDAGKWRMGYLKLEAEIVRLRAENDHFNAENEKMWNENERLRAALQEIVNQADSDDGLTAWDGGDIAHRALEDKK